MMMMFSIDSTSNYIRLWGKISIAQGQTDGGDVAGESSGEIRWVLFVERPQIDLTAAPKPRHRRRRFGYELCLKVRDSMFPRKNILSRDTPRDLS